MPKLEGEEENFVDIIEQGIYKRQRYRVVQSKRQLHGWWDGRRECTGERLLVNPYSGCGHDCPICYANSFPFSHFRHFRRTGEVTVAHHYHREVARQLDSLDWAACGYLSPVSDPFQPLDEKFRLSLQIVEAFVRRNIPIEFITRGRVPADVLDCMAEQPHSFGQVSIVTPREELRRRLSPGSVETDILFENLERISAVRRAPGARPMPSVLRIDPIFPFISDDPADLQLIIRESAARGVAHCITSSLDIPIARARTAFKRLYSLRPSPPVPFEKLFCERIGSRLHAEITYRRKLFSQVRDLARDAGMSFALCMEYEITVDNGGQQEIRGLNNEFMTGTANCEGVAIPVYRRNRSDTYRSEISGAELPRFGPATESCDGNCLACSEARCGLPDMPRHGSVHCRGWKLSDYRRWTQAGKLRETAGQPR